MQRPACCEEKHLRFLDRLRTSGKTNMMGASPYIKMAYPTLTKQQAVDILSYWMQTFPRS
jgi:hypothetical protein